MIPARAPTLSDESRVHVAGPVTASGQECSRCGHVLTLTGNVGWPVGAKILTKGRMSIQCAAIVPPDCGPQGEDDGA